MRKLGLFLSIVSCMALTLIAAPPTPKWEEWSPQWSETFSRFLDAILQGDRASVKTALNNGIAVNWKTESGISPLTLAALTGNDSITMLLLESGARIQPDELIHYAISTNSYRILEWVNENKMSNEYDLAKLLSYALEIGASEKFITFLISKSKISQQDNSYFKALHSNKNHYSTKEKQHFLYLLLKAGYIPTEQHVINYVKNFIISNGDPALLELAKPIIHDIHVTQAELNKALLEQSTIQAFDSLLDKGADPLGATGGGCQDGSGKDLSTPFEQMRGTVCNSSKFTVRYLQFLGRLLERDKKRFGPKLNADEKFLIAVTTGQIGSIRELALTKKENYFLKLKTRDGRSALSLAAETADLPMCQLLCQFKFDRDEHLNAIMSAVTSGATGIISTLLNRMHEKSLSGLTEIELQGCISIMLYQLNREAKNDVEIMKLILDHTRTNNVQLSIPIESYVVNGIVNNPMLVRFLVESFKKSFDNDYFYNEAVRNPAIFLESWVMNKITFNGEKVIRALLPPDEQGSESVVDNYKMVKSRIYILNTLCAKGYTFESAITPGGLRHIGNFNIGYDRSIKRFVLRWAIPTLFSSYGNFDTVKHGYTWYYK
jgi:ankyrin repeat protein